MVLVAVVLDQVLTIMGEQAVVFHPMMVFPFPVH
jgi:hypothetical protein